MAKPYRLSAGPAASVSWRIHSSIPMRPKNPATCSDSESNPGATTATASMATIAAATTKNTNRFVERSLIGRKREEQPPTTAYVQVTASPSTNAKMLRRMSASVAIVLHLPLSKSRTGLHPMRFIKVGSARVALYGPLYSALAGVGGFSLLLWLHTFTCGACVAFPLPQRRAATAC